MCGSNIDINKNSFVITCSTKQLEYFIKWFNLVNIKIPKIYDAKINKTSCEKSTIACINKAIHSNFEYVVIFEEDSYPVFNKNIVSIINTKLNNLDKYDPNWDIVSFGYYGFMELEQADFSKYIRKINHTYKKGKIQFNFINADFFNFNNMRICGTQAYIIKKKAFLRYIKSIRLNVCTDLAITNKNTDLTVYLMATNFFIQRNFEKNQWNYCINNFISVSPDTINCNNTFYNPTSSKGFDVVPAKLTQQFKDLNLL